MHGLEVLEQTEYSIRLDISVVWESQLLKVFYVSWIGCIELLNIPKGQKDEFTTLIQSRPEKCFGRRDPLGRVQQEQTLDKMECKHIKS